MQKKTIEFLKSAYKSAQIKGSRGRIDIFTDRLSKAASEPTLPLAMENLLRSMQSEGKFMDPDVTARMITVASSPDAPRILRWIREQTKLVSALVQSKDDDLVSEALADLELPAGDESGQALPRQRYAIPILATCETPLAHGAEGKAGNATLFRRIDVMATNGAHLVLPYYAGNAVRGQMRDLLSDHFIDEIGLPVSRSKPAVALWFFYCLYSGGALEDKSAAMKAISGELGNHGAVRADGIRQFRQMFPALSLLGCALGNRVLAGRVQFGDLRPVCLEWGTGSAPISELMTWEFLTRREDFEDHTEHHGMIANTELLRAGVQLEGGVDYDHAISSMELSALGCGLELLRKRGMLGAENRRGLGRVKLAIEDHLPDSTQYLDYLRDNRDAILGYMREIDALADGGDNEQRN